MRQWLSRWLGDRGERRAARFLRKQGLKIVARQYRNRFGEIDIIARDADRLVFVEVKTWRAAEGGSPSDAVDLDKQRRLSRSAAAYLKRRGLYGRQPVRFDVVGIVWPDDAEPTITWYRNAFESTVA
ncbi:YraN family protein [Thalassoroseus pseudoceratinae]|uniref:YraN family protein n=1 Tax=Thalassoroseus pseudoceratinae TaxID=2713176 RepID=UPI001421180E|nr:YraN family protein [Thalassoroseus pseudoceratinae]